MVHAFVVNSNINTKITVIVHDKGGLKAKSTVQEPSRRAPVRTSNTYFKPTLNSPRICVGHACAASNWCAVSRASWRRYRAGRRYRISDFKELQLPLSSIIESATPAMPSALAPP